MPIKYDSLLSPAREKVAVLFVAGLTDAEIAAKLFLSVGTVKSHVTNIMAKFMVNSRCALMLPLLGYLLSEGYTVGEIFENTPTITSELQQLVDCLEAGAKKMGKVA